MILIKIPMTIIHRIILLHSLEKSTKSVPYDFPGMHGKAHCAMFLCSSLFTFLKSLWNSFEPAQPFVGRGRGVHTDDDDQALDWQC